MKKIFDFLFSMQFAGTLMLVFAAAIGTATIIENDLGTLAARLIVYEALWFEVLLIVLAIGLIGSIFKYKLIQQKKYSVLLFHISFIVILLGSGITRFFSYEGSMRIREGQTTNQMISAETYVQLSINDGGKNYLYENKRLFNPYKSTKFDKQVDFGTKSLDLTLFDYIPNATQTIVEDPNGSAILSFVHMSSQGQQNSLLKLNDELSMNGVSFSFNNQSSSSVSVKISQSGTGLIINSPYPIELSNMNDASAIKLEANKDYAFSPMQMYTINGTRFALRNHFPKAKIKYVTATDTEGLKDVLIFNINYGGTSKQISVTGGKGFYTTPSYASIQGINFELNYGPKIIELPFELKLIDFQLDRYPGSMSPSSFASEVMLIDKKNNINEPRRIFMNNILNYGGYRFFQSSYDKDELGTVLSVNYDFWGTSVTYFGYFIMTLGMTLNFFSKKSRFRNLIKETSKINICILLLIGASILLPLSSNAQNHITAGHAASFGDLMVIDQKGRIKPINTLSSEILRKVVRKSEFLGLNPNQVFLGMHADPATWQNIPMIKVKDTQLKRILGIRDSRAAYNNFFDQTKGGIYKLSSYINDAYNTKPADRGGFEKDLIKVDERLNICYMIYTGKFLKVFPLKNDPNNNWVISEESSKFSGDEAAFVNSILPMYFESVKAALGNNNWLEASTNLNNIKLFQAKYGSQIFPSKTKLAFEKFYNKVNIFERLFPFYSTLGFVLLILLFIKIINGKNSFKLLIKIGLALFVLGFASHTIGLAIRWYISGHAPMSNGFESMIFIAWATILAGLFFIRKSKITVAVTAILASLTLMVAHLSWMDPEITNLVPVLKSYWLTIHVSVITASYSFLAIGALLGFLNLIMMIFRNPNNMKRLNSTIAELTKINEMNLIVGGYLLTIGTFLGAVWANESWGRYWGWDPKETWALVTVVVYAFIVHMRYIPGLKGIFTFNFVALISFGSVLMTYFGVNYYLSGMHSYASGDPVPVPTFVYYTIIIIIFVSVYAYLKDQKMQKLTQKK